MNSNYTIQHPVEPPQRDSQSPPHRRRKTAAIQRSKITALALAWVLALLCPFSARAQSYTATLIQPASSTFHPRSMNDQAEVAGYCYFVGGSRPFVWRNGTLVELPLLPGASAGIASGLNNAGQIVGYCVTVQPDSTTVSQACLWENGSVTALPTPAGAETSEAVDINDAGGVVGYALMVIVYPDGTLGSRQDAVVWQGDSVQAIIPPDPNTQMYAHAIEPTGRVAVSIYDDWFGGWIPARWTPDVPNGTTGTVEVLDWSGGVSFDINDSGVVCGYDFAQRAVVWGANTTTMLGVLPGDHWAYAASINQAGTIAGTSVFYDTAGTDYTAFVGDAERGLRDLNALIGANSAQYGKLTDALAINNAGQILAVAGGGCVLLTPSTLPPPLPAPTGLNSQAGNHSVALSWNAVTVADGYNVKRSTISGGSYTTIAAGVTSTSYVDGSAINGIRYYYVVSALAGARESANSSETIAKPLAPPLAPTGLAAKVAKAKVQLTWRQSTSPEITRNRIYRSINGGAFVLMAEVAAGLTWTDNQARSRTNYTYAVTALNANRQESPFSNAVSAQPK